MRPRLLSLSLALAAVMAASVSPLPARAEPPAAKEPKPAQIDKNGVLILVRSALLALDHANKTGNYTVFRDLAAPGFREANTAARLGDIFAGQRKDKLDLAGVAALEPQLTLLPQIESNGFLRLAGFFPSVPTQITFELLYEPIAGQWRLFGLNVSLGQAAPAAPALAENARPAPAEKAPPAKKPPALRQPPQKP